MSKEGYGRCDTGKHNGDECALPPPECRYEPAPSPPPETEWTSTPPTEPGWYWSELECGTRPPIWSRAPRKIIEDDGVLYQINGGNDPRDVREMATRGWRWWPVPIAPPRREPR